VSGLTITPTERQRLDERARDPEAVERREREAEQERLASRRLWSALMMTADDLEVCRSILLGRPVLARQLDAEALRRGLRGQPLPPPASYFRVLPGHLDAIAEGGPFQLKVRTKR